MKERWSVIWSLSFAVFEELRLSATERAFLRISKSILHQCGHKDGEQVI